MAIGPVIIDIEGQALTDDDRALLQHPLVGGLIYFARNFESLEQIQALNNEIRRIRPELLIAVDQEGGRVQRFKAGFTRLPAMQRFLPLFHKSPKAALSLVADCGWLMAAELLCVGVDFSFAPVLDVDDHYCSVIADRSFSNQPEEVVQLAGAFMAGMNEAGMATTGKHFPGHGSVSGDSHVSCPVDQRGYDDIEQHDLVPFKALLNKLDALMPAHITFPQVDPQPVGFSAYWLQTVVRQQLGFNGVIFSDDLTMEGAAIAGDYGQRAEAALQAGCDMLLVCNNRTGVNAVLEHLSHSESSLLSNTARLEAMSARKVYTHSELQHSERYIKARNILMSLMAT